MNLDPRIGLLSGGKYYCFPQGYGQPELIGTLDAVEAALGLRPALPASTPLPQKALLRWSVRLTFQYPAWDEVAGLVYQDIAAASKSEANAIARRRAAADGHLGGGKGRATFTATELTT